MRIKLSQTPFISRKIVLDLLASDIVRLVSEQSVCESIVLRVLQADLANEAKLDAKVNEILAERESEIDLMQANEKSLFWLTKRHLAEEFGVIIDAEERKFALAAQVLAELVREDAIGFTVSDLRVRNVIFKAIDDYLQLYEELDEVVYEKIKNHKRRLIPGSEEYEIIYQKLYQEELAKRGLA